MPQKQKTLIYELALLLTVIVWGVNFPVVKAALQVIHPFVFNALRFTVSVLLLGVLYFRQHSDASRRGKSILQLSPWRIIPLAVCGQFIYQIFFILGIQNTTSGNAALIMTSVPLWVALIGLVFSIEHLRRLGWIGLTVTICGTMLVIIAGPESIFADDNTFLGNLLMVGAALSWGGYTAFSRPILRDFSSRTVTFCTMLIAIPGIWAIAVPHIGDTDWSNMHALIWVAILYSGLLSTGLAYIFWNMAIQNVGATSTATSGNLVPLIALVTGFFLLGEPVTIAQILGGILMITGIVLMRTTRTAADKPLPDTKGT